MDITAWAHNLTKEIYDTWTAKYAFWKPGMKVFYSPAIQDPKLMIVTYQPGGGQEDFEKEDSARFEQGDFAVHGNDYIDTNYRMAVKTRSFFDFDPTLALLKESVIVPLLFFRAPSVHVWEKDLSPQKKAEMEKFAFSKAKEIVDTVHPKKILVIGIKTYKKLKELLGEVQNETVIHTRNGNGEQMAVTAEYQGIKLFAVIHFTGARLNKTDWKTLKELFKSWQEK